MNAGLPGLGLGGLFFILTALFAPLIELGRTIRGESSPAAWATVGRQFALAVAMIVAIELTLRGALLLVANGSVTGVRGGHGVTVLHVAPLAITVMLLSGLLVGAKGVQLALRARESHLPARVTAVLIGRGRDPVCAGTALVAILVSLLVGAAGAAPPAAAPRPEARGEAGLAVQPPADPNVKGPQAWPTRDDPPAAQPPAGPKRNAR